MEREELIGGRRYNFELTDFESTLNKLRMNQLKMLHFEKKPSEGLTFNKQISKGLTSNEKTLKGLT